MCILPMRYFVQFLIPALILFAVIYLISRRRSQQGDGDGRGVFLVILVIGAVAAVAALFALQGVLD